MQRVAIVQTVLPHYRVPFFAALSRANPDWQVEVIHSSEERPRQETLMREGFLETNVRRVRFAVPGFNLSMQTGALRRLCGPEVDAVVLEGSFGILSNLVVLIVRKLRRRPILYWAAGWERPDLQGWKKRVRAAVVRFLAARADGIVVYGSTARRCMAAHGVPAERIAVAQNTIDVENLVGTSTAWHERGRMLKSELGIKGRCVLYVGQIVPNKRLGDLILAMSMVRSRIPDAELIVVGTGPELTRARSQAGEGVHFVGEVVEGVQSYFASADLFVMPGTGGLALNQAMAFGLPVVVTVSDGTHEDLVVAGDNGLVAPIGDPAALADCIVHVLEDPARRARMGERSRQIVLEKATLANMVKEFSRAVLLALGQDLPTGQNVISVEDSPGGSDIR